MMNKTEGKRGSRQITHAELAMVRQDDGTYRFEECINRYDYSKKPLGVSKITRDDPEKLGLKPCQACQDKEREIATSKENIERMGQEIDDLRDELKIARLEDVPEGEEALQGYEQKLQSIKDEIESKQAELENEITLQEKAEAELAGMDKYSYSWPEAIEEMKRLSAERLQDQGYKKNLLQSNIFMQSADMTYIGAFDYYILRWNAIPAAISMLSGKTAQVEAEPGADAPERHV